MKVKTVTYSVLRVTKVFENDRAEVTIELEPGDTAAQALARARKECKKALNAPRGMRAPIDEDRML